VGRSIGTHLAPAAIYVYDTYMTKKLTITVSDEVYEGLHRRIGRRKMSRFIDDLARKHVIDRQRADYWLTASKPELRRAYAEEAAYEARRHAEFKQEDAPWLNGLIGDVLRADDETR
jgi:predicted CopG family antitoxin